MNNPKIVISAKDMKQYVTLRERKAQIAILKRIKPLGNGAKIENLISRIANGTLNKKVTSKCDQKKNVLAKEIRVSVTSLDNHKDYSDIEQFMVVADDA